MKGLMAMLVLTATIASAPHPIAIVINGNTLSLQPPARIQHGLLLVPLRHTIEALGLTFSQSGKRITTQVGSKTVMVTVGSRVAQIDKQSVTLEAPATEIEGVVYVPLRFFTDVLGAQSSFDRRANTVTIVAQLVGRSVNGLIPTANGFQRFGTVAAVDVLSDPPTISLSYHGGVKTIPIAPNATIEVQDVNVNVTSPGELTDIRPGDFARIEMRKDGRVQSVTDEYGSRNGHIVAIAGNQFVLGNGQVDHTHEEIQLLAIDFSSMLLETTAPMPTWRDAYRARDQRPSYAYLRRILQVLQWLRGGTRWVLKSPQHLEQFPALVDTFPDATFVVTHRDPVAVTTSMVTMLAYSARLTRGHVDVPGIGRYWADRLELMLRSCARGA